MALTKASLAEHIHDVIGLNKREAMSVVEDLFETIRQSLESGDCVKIANFGNFLLRDKNERPGRNPKTGEAIPVRARRVVTFRPSRALKSNISKSSGETHG